MILNLQALKETRVSIKIKSAFLISFIFGALVFLLLLLFQPFEYRSYPLFRVFSDSLLTAFLVFVITFITRVIIPSFSNIELDDSSTNPTLYIYTKSIVLDISIFLVLSFIINLLVGGFNNHDYLDWLVSTLKYIMIFEILFIPLSLFIKRYIVLDTFFRNTNYSIPSESVPLDFSLKKEVLLSSGLDKEEFLVYPGAILAIKSSGNYVEIFYFNKGEVCSFLLRNTLANVGDKLIEYPFLFRCHRSYLVNTKMVEKIKGNARGYQLTITGLSIKIPVSRSKITWFNKISQS